MSQGTSRVGGHQATGAREAVWREQLAAFYANVPRTPPAERVPRSERPERIAGPYGQSRYVPGGQAAHEQRVHAAARNGYPAAPDHVAPHYRHPVGYAAFRDSFEGANNPRRERPAQPRDPRQGQGGDARQATASPMPSTQLPKREAAGELRNTVSHRALMVASGGVSSFDRFDAGSRRAQAGRLGSSWT